MGDPPPPPRILLAGDPQGRLRLLFKRVTSVNQSTGPFDALFCVGQFFSDESEEEVSDYVQGRASVPIPTYFTGAYGGGGGGGAVASQLLSKAQDLRGFHPQGIEICPNLYWLRGSAKFNIAGLSVVYLSGKGTNGNANYTVDDVDALRALADEPGVVDLFLTNEWPSGVANGADLSHAPPQVTDPSGCDPLLAQLVAEIEPRYHIAGTKNVFYAREPYINDGAVHVTRFIGLGTVGNKDKQRFIHAISPTPASTMSAAEIGAKPPNTTQSPYQNINMAPNDAKGSSNSKDNNNNNSSIAIRHETQYWRYDAPPNKRQKQRLLCFKFTSSGSCPQDDKCNFTHEPEAREHYTRNVCFDFLNKGKCERGTNCKFRHSLSESDDVSANTQPASAR